MKRGSLLERVPDGLGSWLLSTRQLLMVAAIFAAWLGSTATTFAQQNIFETIIQGTANAVKSQQATAEWQKISPQSQSCLNTVLQRHSTSIAKLAHQGIGPNDPRLTQAKKNCEQITSMQFRENFPCTLKQASGALINSQCDEAFAVLRSGQLARVTRDQAIVEVANNSKVSIAQFERLDALAKRQEADRLVAAQAREQATRAAQQQREESQRREVQRREDDAMRLEIARLEAERAKAQAEAARLQADAETQKRVEAERARKQIEETERKRAAEERERARVAQVNALSSKVDDGRKACKPATEPVGWISSFMGKSDAFKTVADIALPLSDGMAPILPYAVDGKDKEATAALAMRIVAQSLSWNASPSKFGDASRDFVRSLQMLQRDCLFDAVDYLASKNANLVKAEVDTVLGYEATSPNVELVEVLRLARPSALQQALSRGEIAWGARYITEDKRQVDEEKQRKGLAEQVRQEEEKKRQMQEAKTIAKVASNFPPQQLVDCFLSSALVLPFVKAQGNPATFEYSSALASVLSKLATSLPDSTRRTLDYHRVERMSLDGWSLAVSKCMSDQDVKDLVIDELARKDLRGLPK